MYIHSQQIHAQEMYQHNRGGDNRNRKPHEGSGRGGQHGRPKRLQEIDIHQKVQLLYKHLSSDQLRELKVFIYYLCQGSTLTLLATSPKGQLWKMLTCPT